jgi:uncharacterized membrane protein
VSSSAPPPDTESTRWALFRSWFIAGLLVWIPLAATLLVIRFLVGLLDTSLLLIPPSLRPDFPGLGVILSIVLVVGTGALIANILGARLWTWAERQLDRIPLVRSLYGGTKKLAETLFSESSSSFKKVVLVEWPRSGAWAIGFQAGEPIPEVAIRTGLDLVAVFVPTAPIPTSGYLMQLPRHSVTVLDMSIEEAMRYIVSLGVATPAPHPEPTSILPLPTLR